jgi:chromosome segregation ATPase
MQPTTTAQTTAATVKTPITQGLRDFYQNIAGTPTSQQAEGDVTSFNKMTPRTADILSAFDEQYGVNAASSRVGDLRKGVMQAEDLVNNVGDNVFARTSNSLVSDAQRARLTAAEKDPLSRQLNEISRNFDVANQDLSGLKEQSNRFSGAEIGDIGTMRDSLGTRLTTSQQREAAQREAEAAAEQQRQWWANYELQRQQTAAQVKELEARVAATQRQASQSYDLSSFLKQLSSAGAPAAPAAPAAKAITNKSGTILGYDTPYQSYQTDAGNQQQAQQEFQQRASQSAIGKYGPLALFGGGWLWK